jgi:hypothetical protein
MAQRDIKATLLQLKSSYSKRHTKKSNKITTSLSLLLVTFKCEFFQFTSAEYKVE